MTARRLPTFILLGGVILAGCTTTDVLEPSAIVQEPQAAQPGAVQDGASALVFPEAAAAQVSAATAPQASAATIAATRLQFAPVVGTPVAAATPLGTRLMDRARAKGYTLARAGEPTSHILKGYFSALPEDGKTTIVYVWDVLDSAGNRLHRIQGQQIASGGDGWSSVTPAVMEGIADTTIEQLTAWLGSRPG